MAEIRRKTTIEERKEIVNYCINHNRDYKNTAAKFDVSYSQVYSWVKKYEADGESGLTDRRGQHKVDNEIDELERLRRENLRLKRHIIIDAKYISNYIKICENIYKAVIFQYNKKGYNGGVCFGRN